MKKIPLLLLLTGSLHLHAQVFQARDFNVALSAGVQELSFHLSDTAGYRNEYNGLRGPQFMLRAEFGLSNFMGIGAGFSYTRVLSEMTSIDKNCHAFEFTPEVAYHVPWKNRFVDLGGGAGIGLFRYTYWSMEEDETNTELNAVSYFAEFRPRFYFSKKNRTGVFLYYRFTYYYGYGATSDKTTPQFQYDTRGQGNTFGGGLFYRFGPSRTKPQPAEENAD